MIISKEHTKEIMGSFNKMKVQLDSLTKGYSKLISLGDTLYKPDDSK